MSDVSQTKCLEASKTEANSFSAGEGQERVEAAELEPLVRLRICIHCKKLAGTVPKEGR